MSRSVGQRRDNTFNERFRIRFVERLYDGAARWYENDWRQYVDNVQGDNGWCLNREPTPRRSIINAHNSTPLHTFPGTDEGCSTHYLATCVNPTCQWRQQGLFDHGTGNWCHQAPGRIDIRPGTDPDLVAALRSQLCALANGNLSAFRECERCGEPTPVFPIRPIQDKWIYIFKEEGDSLAPYVEIHSETQNTGRTYRRWRDGQFIEQDSIPFPGYVYLSPDPLAFTWRFFLSPVRLGPQALELLLNCDSNETNYHESREEVDAEEAGVSVMESLQPWVTTVHRRFSQTQLRQSLYEYVPLIDPFSWAVQITEFDYRPIVQAQQQLIRDSDEQAKHFISSTLAHVMGRRQTSNNPPEYETDAWDVADDTVEPPPTFSDSENIAQAWGDRYRQTLEYLTEETNKACNRLIFVLRYTLAHAIVELACQERNQTPGFLSYGLMHWNHILRDILLCREGLAFTAWLTSSDAAASSIPRTNVMQGVGLEENSDVATEVGNRIPMQIFGNMAPIVIRDAEDPVEEVATHMRRLNINVQVHTTSVGAKELWSGTSGLSEIPIALVNRELASIPVNSNLMSQHVRRLRLGQYSDGLQTFSNMRNVIEVLTLLKAICDYNKSGQRFDSSWENLTRARDIVGTPSKVISFLAKQSQTLSKAQFAGAVAEVTETLSSQGIRGLNSQQLQIYRASASLQAYRGIGIATRVLAGPMSLIIGGVELVIESGETVNAWRTGDMGVVAGNIIQIAAVTLTIVVAAAECVALATGAGAVAWAGPVGAIAALIMFLGAIVIYAFSKNDLELFAAHCWLGEHYGEGGWSTDTGKSWLAGQAWASLRYDREGSRQESRERWQRQRVALLRLLGSFKTWVGRSTYCGGYIFPGHIGDGGAFEFDVRIRPAGSDSSDQSQQESYHGKVWPHMAPESGGGDNHYVFLGQTPRSATITVWRGEGGIRKVTIELRPNMNSEFVDYDFDVRLDLNGGSESYLPVDPNYVDNSSTLPGIYSERSDSDID